MRISLILILIITFFIGPLISSAQVKKKVKIKYRKYTSFDFAGDQVAGKLKGASVFYIFQRKRAKGHQVIVPPSNFNWHKDLTKSKIKGAIQ